MSSANILGGACIYKEDQTNFLYMYLLSCSLFVTRASPSPVAGSPSHEADSDQMLCVY